MSPTTPLVHTFPSAPKVLHVQNPGKLQTFKNVAGWLKEATGAQLEGVSMDEFRGRLSKAVEEEGRHDDAGVLAQVCVYVRARRSRNRSRIPMLSDLACHCFCRLIKLVMEKEPKLYAVVYDAWALWYHRA